MGLGTRWPCELKFFLRESPDGTGRETCTTQGELNLEEVGKGRKPASNLLPFETLAEVDFYCFRKPDLTV